MAQQKAERQFFIDWLRAILIFSVFIFHIGLIFTSWHFGIDNNALYDGLIPYMEFLHLWRMPLLFLISGIGTFYAIKRKTKTEYLGERFLRLFIPLIAGIFLLTPIQIYFIKIDEYNSLWHFYKHMFEGLYPEGNFTLKHLWFILYLFFISLIISPFLKLSENNKLTLLKNWLTSIFSNLTGLHLIILPLIASQLLFKPFFPYETRLLFNDWAYFSKHLIFFLAGLVFVSNQGIVELIKKFRVFFIIESIVLYYLLKGAHLFESDLFNYIYKESIQAIFLWTCSLTVIGYAKKYLNFGSKVLKIINEATYPFYLLHQPILIILSFWVTEWAIHDLVKALILFLFTLLGVIVIYLFFIRPYNFMRVIFGMKPIPQPEKTGNINLIRPVFAYISNKFQQK